MIDSTEAARDASNPTGNDAANRALAAESDERSERGESAGSRVGQRRQLRRAQISFLPLALCVIGLGVLLLVAPDALIAASPYAIGFGAALIGLALALRFLLNRREERGIGTVGLTVLFTAIAVAGTEGLSSTLFSPAQIGAIGVVCSGLAVWLAAALAIGAARGTAIGTGLIGTALIVAGGLALAFSSGLIDLNSLPATSALQSGGWVAYWPIGVLVLAVLLLPLAIRRRN